MERPKLVIARSVRFIDQLKIKTVFNTISIIFNGIASNSNIFDFCVVPLKQFAEFRRALQIIQESRLGWQESAAEVQRLQRELDRMQCLYDECIQERLDLQTKLLHAHRFSESEIEVRRKLVGASSMYIMNATIFCLLVTKSFFKII